MSHSTSDFLGKARVSLMMIYGEFEAFAQISECIGLLINGGFIAKELILRMFWLFGTRLRSVGDEASKLDRLRLGST